jgi:hypothetical protein
MKSREAAVRYIEAKKNKTKCMQAHFKQLCTRCRFYMHGTCGVYNAYVQAWMDLQRSVDETIT